MIMGHQAINFCVKIIILSSLISYNEATSDITRGDCNFDNGICGYSNPKYSYSFLWHKEDFTWEINKGDIRKYCGGIEYDATRPLTDHTSRSGSYPSWKKYIIPTIGKVVQLRSPTLHSTTPFCLRFWYFTYELREYNFKFNVKLVTSASPEVVWKAPSINRPSKPWTEATIDLPGYKGGFKVIFEAVVGENKLCIAFDDVKFTDGRCTATTSTTASTATTSAVSTNRPNTSTTYVYTSSITSTPTISPSTTSTSTSTSTTISTSTTTSNTLTTNATFTPTSTIASTTSNSVISKSTTTTLTIQFVNAVCNFETDMCGYSGRPDNSSMSSWKRVSLPGPSLMSGRVYLEVKLNKYSKDASITTPTLQAGIRCLRFTYYLSSEMNGSVELSAALLNRRSASRIFTAAADGGGRHQANTFVDLPPSTENFKIRFSAKRMSVTRAGNSMVALDDIRFDGGSCSDSYDSTKLIWKRLDIKATYGLKCNLIKSTDVYATLKDVVKYRYQTIMRICEGVCNVTSTQKVATECKQDVLSVTWSSRLLLPDGTTKLPEHISDVIKSRLKQNKAALDIFVFGHTPPVIAPRETEYGLPARVVLS